MKKWTEKLERFAFSRPYSRARRGSIFGYVDLKIKIKIVFKAKSQSFGGYFVTKILLNTKKKRADGLFHDSRQWSEPALSVVHKTLS